MSRSIRIILLLLFTAFAATSSYAQSKSELEKKRARLQREIRQTNEELKSTRKSRSSATAQLNALKKKIELREELIRTINSEISDIDTQISSANKDIDSLQQRMEALRESYAEMIRFAQRNRNSYQKLMYLFASDDFNQALKRIRYLHQYSESRQTQAAGIDSAQQALEIRKAALEAKKEEKTALRNAQLKQKESLKQEQAEKDKLVAQLRSKEQKLRKDLARKQKAKKQLDKAIDELIRKEIEAAKKRAAAEGKKNVTSANVFTLTPEAKKLSASFAGNKGSLPWPVTSGRIVSSFGDHAHPELKGITIHNNGVDIRTEKNADVRSVFSGEVTGVITIPGANSAVIIRHGEYLTVYSNLSAVYVKKGDKVNTKQSIGRAYTDPEEGNSEVHLEIWKGTAKLDPAQWLARR
jgi:septal ring factor EnvC (AmiA/AmiB activator)